MLRSRNLSKLDTVLAQLTALHPKKIDLGLGRIARVLKALGNPQLRLPPAVHIAGTNGKGSTTAFLRAMIEAEGKSAHIYTSPHLVRFNERMTLASEEIADDVLLGVLQRVMDANAGAPLSFFEATDLGASNFQIPSSTARFANQKMSFKLNKNVLDVKKGLEFSCVFPGIQECFVASKNRFRLQEKVLESNNYV